MVEAKFLELVIQPLCIMNYNDIFRKLDFCNGIYLKKLKTERKRKKWDVDGAHPMADAESRLEGVNRRNLKFTTLNTHHKPS
jgi:hypothetical protein